MTYEFKPGEYKTRNGLRAEVLAEHNGSLVGAMYDKGRPGWSLRRWRLDGAYFYGVSYWDLMPPESHEDIILRGKDAEIERLKGVLSHILDVAGC